jgi:serine kinase of HPr protein (carbohydrate metabolism regulator)
MTVHATAVAHHTVGGWQAVILRGPSGSGKSDLALRLIRDLSWRLVGDDRIHLWRSGDELYTAPAERLAGLLEVRHVGLMAVPYLTLARVALIVACETPTERLPEPDTETVAGLPIPRLTLEAATASAPDRVRQALIGLEARSRLEP